MLFLLRRVLSECFLRMTIGSLILLLGLLILRTNILLAPLLIVGVCSSAMLGLIV